jgi:hypothetical protein
VKQFCSVPRAAGRGARRDSQAITAPSSETGHGGGIDKHFVIDSPSFTGDVKLLNDTINASLANEGGGVSRAGQGNVGLQNTIVAGNSGSAAPDAFNGASSFSDLGSNLIGVSGATVGQQNWPGAVGAMSCV